MSDPTVENASHEVVHWGAIHPDEAIDGPSIRRELLGFPPSTPRSKQ
ncbi:MAG: hypothetical protein ACREMY_06470 [bacterium]